MRTKLKICFFGWGNSIHMQRWMQWFAGHGHEIHLITDRPSNIAGITEYDISGPEFPRGSRLRRYARLEFNVRRLRVIRKKMKIDLAERVFTIRKIIRIIGPDIVHLHTLLYPSYLGVFSRFRPLVVTPWNGDIVWKTDWSPLRRFAVRKAISAAALITVDSEELREKTLKYGPFQDKIELVAFGVDTGRFRPDARSAGLRDRYRIPTGAPMILSTRSMEALYNIDVIIRSIPEILRSFPEAVFLFAWHTASEKERMEAIVGELGIAESVRFIGKIEHCRLPELYAESDVFVSVPTGDTRPASLFEAMASGTAPVVSDLPSVRECVVDGVNGCVVPVRDAAATAGAIRNLLSDAGLRKHYAGRNREWVVQNADWDTNMRKVEKLYYGLASPRIRESYEE